MISRRRFLAVAAGGLGSAAVAGAQGSKPPRVGVLANNWSPKLEGFRQGLRALGYVEGQTILIELRDAGGRPEQLPPLAAELVRLPVDVIAAPDPPSAAAAKAATATIPIVIRSSDDPVATGFVASLARPGGNVTGVYSLYGELGPKRLELLKQAIPGLARVGVLWSPRVAGLVSHWKGTAAAAGRLGLLAESLEVQGVDDLARAFELAVRRRGDHAERSAHRHESRADRAARGRSPDARDVR